MKNSRQFMSLVSGIIGPLLALVVIVLIFAVADSMYGSGKFLTGTNIRHMSNSAALIAVPALGMTMIIIAGGIDLSAGTALTLCGTVLATMLKNQEATNVDPGFAWAVTWAVVATLLTGCLCGIVNGGLITTTQVVPFIVSLGTMSIFLGIGQIIAQESTVTPNTQNIPQWLAKLCFTGSNGDEYILISKVPTSAILALMLAVMVGAILRYTIFGRNLFAIGSNRSTARLCGVPIAFSTISVYMIAGLFFAVGGLFYYADVKSGNPMDGSGRELHMIAAVVLGGGSLSGGRGSAIGTLIGALIIVVIRSGCTQLSIPNTYTHIIIGVIIIIAVIVDQLRNGSPEWLFRMLPRSKAAQ